MIIRIIASFFCLFISFNLQAQSIKISANTGNLEEILSAGFDHEKNQLITLDRAGYVVVWDISNFSVVQKFQLVPKDVPSGVKVSQLDYPELAVYDKIITVTYPKYMLPAASLQQEITDMYDRISGGFLGQSPNNYIGRIAFTKQADMFLGVAGKQASGGYFIRNEAYLFKYDNKNNQTSVDLKNDITFICVNDALNVVALGFDNGLVEIRDIKTMALKNSYNDFSSKITLKISQITFVPNSTKVAFTAFMSKKILVKDIQNDAYQRTLSFEDENLNFSISPSGKKIAAKRAGVSDLFISDMEKGIPERINIYPTVLNGVHFLNENVLIGYGKQEIENYENYNAAGINMRGAFVGFIDIKNKHVSTNLNISTNAEEKTGWGTQLIKTSTFGTLISNTNGAFTFTNPQKLLVKNSNPDNLKDAFVAYWNKTNKDNLVSNFSLETVRWFRGAAAPDLNDAEIVGIMYHKTGFSGGGDSFLVANYNIPGDSFINAYPLKIDRKKTVDCRLIGVLKNGYAFFEYNIKDDAGNTQTRLAIYNNHGKLLLDDKMQDNFGSGRSLSVSAGMDFFAYQNSPGNLVIRNVSNMKIVHQVNIGFSITYNNNTNGYAYPYFLPEKPDILVHEVSKDQKGSQYFCLVGTNIKTKVSDTLINFGIRPMYYDVDGTATNIVLSYNYDFTEFVDEEKVAKAKENNFKTMYKPIFYVYNTDTADITDIIHHGTREIVSVALRNGWFTVLRNDGALVYYKKDNPENKILQLTNGMGQAIINDSFYYATPDMIPFLRMNVNNRSSVITQADIYLNRPHKILQLFNEKNTDAIIAYEAAYLKRINQDVLSQAAFYKLSNDSQQIYITAPSPQNLVTELRKVSLPFSVSRNKSSISKIYVYINGFPVYGSKGLPAQDVIKKNEIDVILEPGRNYITLTAETISGKRLEPVKYYYNCTNTAAFSLRKLYFFSAGVSNYKDTLYNLRYAAKDAQDILKAFRSKSFSAIVTDSLINENVTVQNVLKWKKVIENAGVDDVVILYFAGHGLLDAKNDFYFATHDMDFKAPQKRGLSYKAILDMLDVSPSRNKILLLDACHSGAFDKSAGEQTIVPRDTAVNGKVVNNEKRGVNIKKVNTEITFSERQAFLFMNQLFTDFTGNIGVDVIAASLGNSYALENEKLQNGLFTYSLIRGVALNMASGASNGGKSGYEIVTLPDLKTYISREVKMLSNGAQVPSIRANNVQAHTLQFLNKPLSESIMQSADDEYNTFIEKYK